MRINHLTTVITNLPGYEAAIIAGIKVYSRYIKGNRLTRNNQVGGFFQSLENQFRWGILEEYQVGFLVNPRINQYLEYERDITILTNCLFRTQGANPNFNNPAVQTAKQNLCWCLFNYRPNLPLYRVVLREYIETYYTVLHQELQTQNNLFSIATFNLTLEPFLARVCAHLHFSIEDRAALLITARGALFASRLINNRNAIGMDAQQF